MRLGLFGILLAMILGLSGTVLAQEPLQQRFASQTDPKTTPRDDARIISARFSAHPTKGQVADLEVTVRNTGTTTWTWTDPYHFYALGIGPAGTDENYKGKAGAIWVSHPGGAMPGGFDGNRITLQEKERIGPGETKKFGCRVEYKKAGKQYVVLQMLKENDKAVGQKNPNKADGWFGERMRVLVTIAP